MKAFKSAFAAGLLVMVPVFATLGVVRWVIMSLDSVVRSLVPGTTSPVDFPGFGLVVFLLLITITGFLAQNYLGRAVFSALDGFLRRVAIFSSIYGPVRKLMETVLNPQSDRFSGVVLVQFPRPGIYVIGFRTGAPERRLDAATGGGMVSVFVPQTPNPTSGFYVLVKESEVVPLAMTVQEAFRAVLSMGLVGGDETPPAKVAG